ncbi:unnamed protein product [Somion occarium]|uniref:Uncharacterized protein n=1 Tax=Somion occarium TaxID=3059160 RepID=A0ABP1CMD8_9APHY
METLFRTLIRTHSQHFIHSIHRPEDRPAELHPTLQNTSSIVSDNPFRRNWGESLGGVGWRVLECKFVEAETDLGVGSVGDVVELPEVVDVRGWEGIVVAFKAF